ncbi:MAG: hypothetical protein GF331_26455 [Chitinivibrionales bacterium]|nr:hypothetical protein [Chitinivibrionales bacterium]
MKDNRVQFYLVFTASLVLMFCGAASAQPPTPVTYGTYLEADLSTPIEVDRYVFSGIAGEHVTIRVNPLTSLDCKIELYNPSGTLDTAFEQCCARQAAIVDYVLDETGSYIFYVSDAQGDETGGYWFSLQCREAIRADATMITYDTHLANESLSLHGAVNAYTFSATAGDSITIRADPSDLFDCSLRLYAPSGTIDTAWGDCCSRKVSLVDHVLGETGIYTLYVSDNDGCETSSYWLTLQCFQANMADARSIVLDSSYVDSIQPRGDCDVFAFEAAAGDRVSVRLKPTGYIASVLVVYAPDGAELYRDTVCCSDLNAAESLLLPESGTYRALLCERDGTGTAAYTFGVYSMMLGHDAVATAMVAPDSVVETGAEIIPAAVVSNFGTSRDTLSVFFRIDSTYVDSTTKILNAYQSDTVRFASWTAPADSGAHAAVCSVAVDGETHLANNVVRRAFRVLRRHDAVAEQIVQPEGIVLPGLAIEPVAVVRNNGTATETIRAYMRIAGYYLDSVVAEVNPGEFDTVTFAGWIPQLGDSDVVAVCSVAVSGDVFLDNNVVSHSVLVRGTLAYLENIVMDPIAPAELEIGDSVYITYDYTSGADSVLVYCVPYSGDASVPYYAIGPSYYHSQGSGADSTWFSVYGAQVSVDSVLLYVLDKNMADTVYAEFVPVDYTFTSPVLLDSISFTPQSSSTLANGEMVTVQFNYSSSVDSVFAYLVPISGDSLAPSCSLVVSDYCTLGTGSASAAFTIDSGVVTVDSVHLYVLSKDTSDVLYLASYPMSFVFGLETAAAPLMVRTLPADYALGFNKAGAALVALPKDEGLVTVTAFDASGRCVAMLHKGALRAGYHCFRWDAAPGLYVVRMVAAGKILSRSVLLAH